MSKLNLKPTAFNNSFSDSINKKCTVYIKGLSFEAIDDIFKSETDKYYMWVKDYSFEPVNIDNIDCIENSSINLENFKKKILRNKKFNKIKNKN